MESPFPVGSLSSSGHKFIALCREKSSHLTRFEYKVLRVRLRRRCWRWLALMSSASSCWPSSVDDIKLPMILPSSSSSWSNSSSSSSDKRSRSSSSGEEETVVNALLLLISAWPFVVDVVPPLDVWAEESGNINGQHGGWLKRNHG